MTNSTGEAGAGAPDAAPAVNTVRLSANGPLLFHAPVRINGEDKGLRVALCRCGNSKNKPFCDGSHRAAGFAEAGEPAPQESKPLAECAGPIEITARPNGPLHVRGPLEVVSASGRTVMRTDEAWLCRCGSSANKPFCDGTHKKIGFRDA